MAMTTKSTLPAAEVNLLPDDADAIEVQTGSDAEPTPVLVAGRDHFRVLDDERMVLYRRGALIPAEHAQAPSVDAELSEDGGGYQPQGPQRAGVQLSQRDTGQPTEPPSTTVLDTATAAKHRQR
jgi:hypothetical protein